MNKKYIIMIVFVISFLSFTFFLDKTFSFESRTVSTDSGFDADYDSGGSSSDGYSSSDRSNRYDSKRKSSSRPITLAEVGAAGVLSIITLIYCITKEDLLTECDILKKILYSILFLLVVTFFLFLPIVYLYELFYYLVNNLLIFILIHVVAISIFLGIKLSKYLKKKKEEKQRLAMIEEYNLVEPKIVKEAYTIYKRVQTAWMDDTIDDVSDILSDEMINMYRAQLTTLRVKKQQNIMKDFKLINGYIMSVKKSKDSLTIKVILEVDCKDYIIKKDTKRVLRGSSKKTNHYNYSLKFLMPLNSLECCPNCGAKLEKGGGITCPSCKSKIIVNNENMILIDKKMNKQS